MASKCSELSYVLAFKCTAASAAGKDSLSPEIDVIIHRDRLESLVQVSSIGVSTQHNSCSLFEFQEIASIRPELNVPDIMKVKITEVYPSSDRPIEFDCRFPLDIDIVATLDPSWSHTLEEIGFQVKIW